MPSSFSRFLSDDELEDVRRLYLESLRDEPTVEAPAVAQAAVEPLGAEAEGTRPDGR